MIYDGEDHSKTTGYKIGFIICTTFDIFIKMHAMVLNQYFQASQKNKLKLDYSISQDNCSVQNLPPQHQHYLMKPPYLLMILNEHGLIITRNNYIGSKYIDFYFFII